MINTPYQDNRIDWLSLYHLLGVHAHQVPQVHARRSSKGLVQAYGREVDGKPPIQLDAAFHCINELGDVGVAGVEARVRVDDAHNRSRESILTVTHGFDEELAHEEREMGVSIRGQLLSKPDPVRIDWLGQVIVGVCSRCIRRRVVLILLRCHGGVIKSVNFWFFLSTKEKMVREFSRGLTTRACWPKSFFNSG